MAFGMGISECMVNTIAGLEEVLWIEAMTLACYTTARIAILISKEASLS